MFIQPSITKGSAGRPLIDCFNWLVGGNHGWKAVYLNQLRGNVEWGLISSSWSTLCGLKRGSFYWGETERDRGSQNGYRWRWTWMGHDEDRDRNLGLKLLSVLNLVQIQRMFTLNVKVFPKLHFFKRFVYRRLHCQKNPGSHESKKLYIMNSRPVAGNVTL